MKRLLSTTTALSLALVPVQPITAFSQAAATLADDGSILAADGTVLCAPTPEQACDPAAFGIAVIPDIFAQPEGAEADAEAGAEAGAAAEVPAENPLIPEPEAPAAEQPAPEAAPEAAPAPQEPTPSVIQEPAPQEVPQPAPEPEVEPAPQEVPATEPEVAPEPEPEVPATEPAPEEAPVQPEEGAPAVILEPEQPQVTEPAPEPATEAVPAEEPAASVEADAQTEAEAAPPVELPSEIEKIFEEAQAAEAAAVEAPVAEAPVEPVDVPEVSEEAAQTVETLLAAPAAEAPETAEDFLATIAAMAAAGQPAAEGSTETTTDTGAQAEAPAPTDVTETTITENDTRSSFEEFAAAPTVVEGGSKKSGLSDLEKAGLLALGAIVVGKILSDGREVVANTGDRVVVREPNGGYQVYKDDDTLLRRPGSTVRTESYRDGSTRTIVTREDGSQVVTIRDATGRVLRRAVYDTRGNETVLINDLLPEQRIDVSTLPEPRPNRTTISARNEDAALRAELARAEAERLGRGFSLRQIREIKEVRRLAAVIDVDNITFDTGSAVIRTTEARKLADLGRVMQDILDNNPDEVFLVEGHTDAVGSAASNLTLSDRRAESVALALTEYFGIPPENMVVQGYGEYDLRVQTDADERRNRRVAVRLISPLMQTASR